MLNPFLTRTYQKLRFGEPLKSNVGHQEEDRHEAYL